MPDWVGRRVCTPLQDTGPGEYEPRDADAHPRDPPPGPAWPQGISGRSTWDAPIARLPIGAHRSE